MTIDLDLVVVIDTDERTPAVNGISYNVYFSYQIRQNVRIKI